LTAISLTLEAAAPASKVGPPIVVTNADQLDPPGTALAWIASELGGKGRDL